MKILLLSVTLIGAGLVIAGPAIAQPTPDKVDPVQTAQRNDNGSSARNADQGMSHDNTTGRSSAKKGRNEAGASSAGSASGSASSATNGISHNDPSTKGRKKAEPD